MRPFNNLREFFSHNENLLAALNILFEMQGSTGMAVPMKDLSQAISTRLKISGTRGNLQGFSPVYQIWMKSGLVTLSGDVGNRSVSLEDNGRQVLAGERPAKHNVSKKDFSWKYLEKDLRKGVHIEGAYLDKALIAKAVFEKDKTKIIIDHFGINVEMTIVSLNNSKALCQRMAEAVIKEIYKF